MRAITRKEIIDAAYSWVDTPYVHRQRVKGPNGGCDCIQFLIGMAIDLDIYPGDPYKIEYYSTQWHLHRGDPLLLQGMHEIGLVEKSVKEAKPADILTFQYARAVSHLGIIVKPGIMIHALMAAPSKVVETRITYGFKKRIRNCFEVPGVID
jgi:cell wall-associated NlpC family hydrolase